MPIAISSCALYGQQLDADGPHAKSWIQIHAPISGGFFDAFETRTSNATDEWRRKLDRFYRTDGMLVYRGVCDTSDRSLADLADMFVSVSEDLLSQGISHARIDAKDANDPYNWTQKNFDLKRSIFADLSRFNRDAFMYSLYLEANIHQYGPVPGNVDAYDKSYGFSTSTSYVMAAEFTGVYPGVTGCTSNLVFGLYPANHFVNFANLAAVDYRFAQAYPDEKETLGIGAVDPDSLMLITRLVAKGAEPPEISELVIRDPVNPDRAYYFDGGIDALNNDIDAGWKLMQADRNKVEAVWREYHVRPALPPSVPPDTAFRLPPGRELDVRQDGRPISPSRVISLNYDIPLFPRNEDAE